MSEQVTVASLPACDFCNQSGDRGEHLVGQVDATYDGKTVHGPWANMCQSHFDLYGVGLGTGKGQRLVVR